MSNVVDRGKKYYKIIPIDNNETELMLDRPALLSLLQLASPALPVGSYSYSEGLETLVDRAIVNDSKSLQTWIENELEFGSIRIDAAIVARSHRCTIAENFSQLEAWNAWLSASRETEELRIQSEQMGSSLLQLFLTLRPEYTQKFDNLQKRSQNTSCHFAIAFGLAAACLQVPETEAILGYLHSWITNIIAAGIKLIPLGQTAGQELLFNLQNPLIEASEIILDLADDDLNSCSWGLALASMQHECQYSRLFRS
ncbi:urease accessory protein UreF [Oxynema aestuarii]|uniref:urease accessory protein UreF n=1 Tax=Oxynema aestuarii TaxID=2874213 RepID=UPI002699C8A1